MGAFIWMLGAILKNIIRTIYKMNRTIKDIENLDSEFKKLVERQSILNSRFTGLTLDYNYYLSISDNEDKLHLMRDNIFYRIYGSNYQVRLILSEFERIQNDMLNLFEEAKNNTTNQQPFLQSSGMNSLVHTTTLQISSLFDSIVYHLSSVFDYIGNIINYIWGDKSSNTQPLKWSSLARSARDPKHELFNLSVGKTIVKLDNDFVEPLYKHRSHLIHKEGDVSSIVFTFNNSEDNPMLLRFMSTEKFCKNFHELRKIHKDTDMTLRYVIFWIFNKAFDTIKELLFSLRLDIINKGSLPFQRQISPKKLMFASISDDGKINSPSTGYWHLDNLL
jgi:hypothetical protein